MQMHGQSIFQKKKRTNKEKGYGRFMLKGKGPYLDYWLRASKAQMKAIVRSNKVFPSLWKTLKSSHKILTVDLMRIRAYAGKIQVFVKSAPDEQSGLDEFPCVPMFG